MSLLLNPFFNVVWAEYITWPIYQKSFYALYVHVKHSTPSAFFELVSRGLIYALSYMAILFLLTVIFKKWLKVEKSSPFLFLYVMYGVFAIILERRGTGEEFFLEYPSMRYLVDMFGTAAILIALFCFFFMDVRAFTSLAKLNVKVDWNIFLIPPIVFIFIYSFLGYIAEFYENDEELVLSIFAFSSIIVYLFIWAFNVIIKNISATNEAVQAKDEAVQAKEEVKTLSVEVMEALAHTIDAKDEYTRGHSVRVAKYSRMLAEKLNLSADECENVYYMALLNDIGKIGVPNEIINSPTKLTDDEYAVIKTHPGTGFGILAEIKSRPDLSIGARWHHERYDGKGYPDGKAGEEIPFYARIIAVADSYDAMTSNHSYRNYLSQEIVRSELEKYSGTQFDPKVAKCMIEIMDDDKNYELHE